MQRRAHRIAQRVGVALVVMLGAAGRFSGAEEGELAATLSAVRAAIDDPEALAHLVAQDPPDPWVVTDTLCAAGEYDAAAAFAKASARPRTVGLAAYVEAFRERWQRGARGAARTQRFEAQRRALREERFADAAAEAVGPLDDVEAVRMAHGQALALMRTGELPLAKDVFLAGAEAAEAMGWFMRAAALFHWAGLCLAQSGRLREAQTLWERRLAVAERAGDASNVAVTLANLGTLAQNRGDLRTAVQFQERALPLLAEAGLASRRAQLLTNIAGTHAATGHFDRALAALEEARAVHQAREDEVGLEQVAANLGAWYSEVGNHKRALALKQEVLDRARAREDVRDEALALSGISVAYHGLGRFAKAMRVAQRALALATQAKDKRQRVTCRINLATISHALGRYPDALAHLEAARTLAQEEGQRAYLPDVLSRIGMVYTTLGDADRAMRYLREAEATQAAKGDLRGQLMSRIAIAEAHLENGAFARAHEATRGVVELASSMDHPFGRAKGHWLGARIALHAGKAREARKGLERARAILESMGERSEVVAVDAALAGALSAEGDDEAALAVLADIKRTAHRMRTPAVLVGALSLTAAIQLRTGDAGSALRSAEQALRELEQLLGGLDEAGASSARIPFARIYGLGALAALELEDVEQATYFVESGRAGALLESLDARQEQRLAELPEALRQAEVDAKTAVAEARQAVEVARRTGQRKVVREGLAALDRARDGVREVGARIQREAKKQAGLFYPRAASLDEIQACLSTSEALVLYAFCLDRALAFVITTDAARAVDLGLASSVREACADAVFDDPDVETGEGRSALRRLLVEPLMLGESSTSVLISPDGPLGYVPFGALIDRPVAFVASGTTLRLLRDEERPRGTGVLGVGHPDYEGRSAGAAAVFHRGRPLSPLPASRAEVEAVASVRLLGAQASERALREAVPTNPRWRAIHLACHGLVDRERPTLSALAMTARDGEDGFLTALEVLRLDLPADAAVLSACDTGRGRLVEGEGIVGLTRAFMYAGAPRVICSLWKVDDAATSALMTRFYELWNPEEGEGMLAAEALRAAQAHVRSQAKWVHPYYWSAWVLWGLPE